MNAVASGASAAVVTFLIVAGPGQADNTLYAVGLALNVFGAITNGLLALRERRP